MGVLVDEFLVNINSFGAFGSIILILFYITLFSIYGFMFHRSKHITMVIIFEIIMLFYQVIPHYFYS